MILYVSDKMQNPNHNSEEDKFAMNFGNFDSNGIFNAAHMGGFNIGMKRSAHDAGLDRDMNIGSEEDVYIKKEGKIRASSSRDNNNSMQQTSLDQQELHHTQQKSALLPNGKKTKGRVKIKMEFIDNKLRRYTTFSKRKTGIMKKAYELSTLTGTQVMLLVASETGHVYTFATRKLQPMITSEAGKALIQTCLNSPDPPPVSSNHHLDQRMSATGYEETELSYAVNEEEHKVRQMMYNSNHLGSSLHHQNSSISPSISSPSSHHAAAAMSLALQSHHQHYQQHHSPHPPPTPHLSSPNADSHHSTMSHSSQNVHLSHSDPSMSGIMGSGLHHHPSHLQQSQTPIPPQSPLPQQPHSPMGVSSPASPYPASPYPASPYPSSPYPYLLQHPHHHIQTHSR